MSFDPSINCRNRLPREPSPGGYELPIRPDEISEPGSNDGPSRHHYPPGRQHRLAMATPVAIAIVNAENMLDLVKVMEATARTAAMQLLMV